MKGYMRVKFQSDKEEMGEKTEKKVLSKWRKIERERRTCNTDKIKKKRRERETEKRIHRSEERQLR